MKKPDLLILSPSNHYYYEENDFKNVRTIVNLIKLNTINNLDTFFTTLIRVLPPNINFVGCFSDSKPFIGNRFLSDLSTRVNNLLDLRTDRLMDKKDVSKLLGRYGFRVTRYDRDERIDILLFPEYQYASENQGITRELVLNEEMGLLKIPIVDSLSFQPSSVSALTRTSSSSVDV